MSDCLPPNVQALADALEARRTENDQFRAAVTMLAGDNARLCGIALAADKLADAVECSLSKGYRTDALRDALDAYTIVRRGS